MATPELSDTTTRNIRVGASAFFLPEHSDAQVDRYVFGYTIVIANNGDRPVQLLSRHWTIIDATGHREEVRGPGVVGQKPRLEPGQAFKYQSFCPLNTPWGTMEGTYQMRADDGETFDIQIGRFYLMTPHPMAVKSGA
jgi:ApaG protein